MPSSVPPSPFKALNGAFFNGLNGYHSHDGDIENLHQELQSANQQLAEIRAKLNANAKVTQDLQAEIIQTRQQRDDAEMRVKQNVDTRKLRLQFEELEASYASLQADSTLVKRQLKESLDTVRRLEEAQQTHQSLEPVASTPKKAEFSSEGWGMLMLVLPSSPVGRLISSA